MPTPHQKIHYSNLANLLDTLLNDVKTLIDFRFADGERRGKADNVTMGWLSQETILLHLNTYVPSYASCDK